MCSCGGLIVSLDCSGLTAKQQAFTVSITVKESEPLMKLAQLICWKTLVELILGDLKKSCRFLHLGRRLCLRIHLGIYLLKHLKKWSDRELEEQLRTNALYQAFCGNGVVSRWHVPDHTKIEEFRNRLSPETHRALANQIAVWAVKAGFADPGHIDVDSTIQQANIAYPSDASLLVKLARKSAQVLKAVDKVFLGNKTGPYAIDLKAIGNKAKGYFFAKAEKKKQALANLVETVQDQLLIPMQSIQSFTTATTNKLSWNIREAINQIKDLGSKILESARYYVKTGKAMPGRIHSMHLTAVDFFNKNKPGKKWEMGRQIQIARLTGNFVITPEHITTHCTDKQAMAHVIKAHAILFGSDQIKSISADKGYYSRANIKSCKEAGAAQIGIQVPHRARVSKEIKLAGEALRNRRAGVEPVIQHVKEHGLNRSKMKSDVATLGSAYQAMGGFNLNQLLRRLR